MKLNRMKKSIMLLLLTMPILAAAQEIMTETRQELKSPDGAYQFTFYQRSLGEDNARMCYTLTYKGHAIVEERELGVLIENQLFESALAVPNDTCRFWCENLKLSGAEQRTVDEMWKPIYGERAEIRDCYNEMILRFRKDDGEGKEEGGDEKLNTRTKVRTTHKKIKTGDKIELKLKASGGAALHFTPLGK